MNGGSSLRNDSTIGDAPCGQEVSMYEVEAMLPTGMHEPGPVQARGKRGLTG